MHLTRRGTIELFADCLQFGEPRYLVIVGNILRYESHVTVTVDVEAHRAGQGGYVGAHRINHCRHSFKKKETFKNTI